MSNADADAIYARVSGDRQEKEATIETQLFSIRRKFSPEDRPVHDTYLDNPFTGTVMSRPALDRCMQAARAGHFNRLLIDHPDRLARGEPWMRAFLERQFKDAGVDVCYASYEQRDTPEGKMMDAIVSAAGSYERGRIGKRMADGHANKRDRGGIWRSRRPYGWRYMRPTGGKKDGHMELEPGEAAIVREIFDRILRGDTSYAVAIDLNRRGLRTTLGGSWKPESVQQIVHNSIHSGRVPTNRYERVQPKNPRDRYNAERKTSSRQRPREEWQFVELPERIVSPEEWERAEACLAGNQRLSRRNAKHEYLLSGLLRCGCERETRPGERCGRIMGACCRHGVRSYLCTRRWDSDGTVSRPCPGRINANKVEAAVWDWIAAGLARPEALLEQVAIDLGLACFRLDDIAEEMAGAEKRRAAYQARLDALLRKYLAGEVDDTTYGRVQAELVEAREDTAKEVEHLRRELEAARRYRFDQDAFQAYCEAAAANLAVLGAADDAEAFAIKLRHVRAFLRAVWVMPDGTIRIEGSVPLHRPDQLAALGVSPHQSIVPQTPGCSKHNCTHHDQAAGLPFSVVLAA